MSATILPLQRRPKTSVMNLRSDMVETVLANDGASKPIDVTQIRILLEDLRVRQDTLLSVIEGLRAPSLRAHPKFGPIADRLDTTSVQALAEVGLLIRRSIALLDTYQGN